MPNNQMKRGFQKVYLDPDNQLFAEVMANGKKYIIPRFQRDYSWENNHWTELWQDIEQMREARSQHFMGYLVFQTEDGKTFQIIDGQQRITTLSIVILAALNKLKSFTSDDSIREENEKRVASYLSTYIGVFDPVTLTTRPKLVLNRHNDAHFKSIASDIELTRQRNITKTNRAINNAFKFFESKFNVYRSGAEIAAVLTDIADGLFFTTITVQDDLNAYTIFETLNARGMHLSIPDLLKNYLLSTMANESAYTEEHFIDFEEQWAGILEQLGETEFTNFLRSYWGMKNKLVNKRELFRTLKKEVCLPNQTMPYLQDLKKNAPVYAALQDHNDNFWKEGDGQYDEARTHIEVLKLFNIKTPLSLLMAGYEKLNPQDFISLLKRIVTIAIRYNVICGKPPKQQETVYNNVANELMNFDISLHDLTNKLREVYTNDDEFYSAFATKEMPSRQSNKKIFFLLRKIEQQLSGEEPPTSLTLEHVLPYSPEDEWQESFGRSNYMDAIDRLGNIALLPSSQNMKQESFETKKEVLSSSSYKINQHIAEYQEWDMDNLNDHQRWLAQQAKTVWKISQLDK